MTLIKLFNSQVTEFLDDVSTVFKGDSNIKTADFFIKNMIKINPSLLIKLWYSEISIHYHKEIEAGNLEFFLNKNYNSDIQGKENPEYIMKIIEIIKKMMSSISQEEKDKVLSYVQNFTKISMVYNK
tara:strand:+ start:491 stop:871 length:381 start_codon:yes stop_codon:yes gene_type:complete